MLISGRITAKDVWYFLYDSDFGGLQIGFEFNVPMFSCTNDM